MIQYAGIWYVGIRAYNGYEKLSIVADYELPGDDGATPDNETLLITNLSGAKGEWQYFTVEVFDTATMQIEMFGGDGDGDLYVKYGENPSATNWDFRPFQLGNDELVDITPAIPGVWHIGIHSYEATSGLSLRVSYPEPE